MTATFKSRNWVWTENNYEGLMPFEPSVMRYQIFSEEIGEEGTRHLQGYTVFHNPVTMQFAKEWLCSRVHLAPRRGTHAEAKSYCSKTDDPSFVAGPYEDGDEPEQGRRTDLEELGSKILQGATAD